MEKQITTGTEITFNKTKEIFELTLTETGFDIRQVKFSKNVTPESWSFQEFLDQYEAGKISIDGFEPTDTALVKSIIMNYIYNNNLKSQLSEVEKLKADIEKLKVENTQLTSANETLMAANEQLTSRNNHLEEENKTLTAKNDQLNVAIEAMEEKTEAE